MFNRISISKNIKIFSEIPDFDIFEMNCPELKISRFADNEIDLSKLHVDNPRLFSRRVLHIFEHLRKSNLNELIDSYDRGRIGIYCSGYKYVYPQLAFKARQLEGLSINKSIRFNCNPNFFLINNGSMIPSHVSIRYGITGPTNFFDEGIVHQHGPLHAYQKAFIDLKLKLTDLAIVLVTNFYDDPIHVQNQIMNLKNKGVNLLSKLQKEIILNEAIFLSVFNRTEMPKNFEEIKKDIQANPELKPIYLGALESLKTVAMTGEEKNV